MKFAVTPLVLTPICPFPNLVEADLLALERQHDNVQAGLVRARNDSIIN